MGKAARQKRKEVNSRKMKNPPRLETGLENQHISGEWMHVGDVIENTPEKAGEIRSVGNADLCSIW